MHGRCARPTRRQYGLGGPDGAAGFLQREARVLSSALALPGDRRRARTAMRAQARAHECWLALVRAETAAGRPGAAELISGLYAFHGLAAGHVERGSAPMLDQRIRDEVGRLLIEQLLRRTDDVIAQMSGGSDDPSRTPVGVGALPSPQPGQPA